mmetsp:Transcript_29108/g.92140  ORF Transcript_29108/g.92140 Transcript_29108/m.92140 type:complete len:313 (-) Transcript_29108:135-1073(-)
MSPWKAVASTSTGASQRRSSQKQRARKSEWRARSKNVSRSASFPTARRRAQAPGLTMPPAAATPAPQPCATTTLECLARCADVAVARGRAGASGGERRAAGPWVGRVEDEAQPPARDVPVREGPIREHGALDAALGAPRRLVDGEGVRRGRQHGFRRHGAGGQVHPQQHQTRPGLVRQGGGDTRALAARRLEIAVAHLDGPLELHRLELAADRVEADAEREGAAAARRVAEDWPRGAVRHAHPDEARIAVGASDERRRVGPALARRAAAPREPQARLGLDCVPADRDVAVRAAPRLGVPARAAVGDPWRLNR